MKLSREQFCKLTDMKPERLKSLDRRGLVPLPTHLDGTQTEEWNHYTPLQAIKMLLADSLTVGEIYPLNRSVRRVDIFELELKIWVKRFVAKPPTEQVFYYAHHSLGVSFNSGSMDKLSSIAEKDVADGAEIGAPIAPIVLVSLTEIFRLFQSRAAEHEIDISWGD